MQHFVHIIYYIELETEVLEVDKKYIINGGVVMMIQMLSFLTCGGSIKTISYGTKII